MNALLKLENVSKTYDTGDLEVEAVRDVSLRIGAQEFVAIMGASGSGKSTLMNILGCLDRPTRGHYFLEGIDVAGLNEDALADIRNRKIGFVFQGFNLLARTSALENIELPMLYARKRDSARKEREHAQRVLEMVGLRDRAEHLPNQLSGGQQQRVAIGRALINQPALLLADEPTGNLDSRTSAEIMELFQDLNQRGITVVMVTHEPAVARYGKRTVVMRDGQVFSDTAASERPNEEKEFCQLVSRLGRDTSSYLLT